MSAPHHRHRHRPITQMVGEQRRKRPSRPGFDQVAIAASDVMRHIRHKSRGMGAHPGHG
jgi:hypothetical protein